MRRDLEEMAHTESDDAVDKTEVKQILRLHRCGDRREGISAGKDAVSALELGPTLCW